jgi:hypothetical protein
MKPHSGGFSNSSNELRPGLVRHHDAFAELARLAKHSKSEQVRIAAIKEILDRAYGKSQQPLSRAR